KNDRLGDAADGQVAGNLQAAVGVLFHLGGLEGDRRVLADVEESIALEVLVAVGLPGVHGGGVNGHVHGGIADVGGVDDDRAVHAVEFTTHGGNHQVRHAEIGAGMPWIDLIGGGSGAGRQCECRSQAGG